MYMQQVQILLRTCFCILAATSCLAQTILTQQLTANGELKWNDIGSAFVQVNSYTLEWAPRLGPTPTVWSPFGVIPATNSSYSVDIPMFYRVRANVEGRFPRLKIAVLSDLHYSDPSLLVRDGTAFQTFLATDLKLFKQSPAIIDQMLADVAEARPDLVLVTGDLTKDGERICHQAMTNRLQQLKAAGARVFVIPGNHDINNPHAVSYDGALAVPVPSVSVAEFATLYAPFGYGDAVARDPNSLSYVAEPIPGLWILAMDACHPERNTNGTAFVGGYFDPLRLSWLTNQLAAARAQGKFVLGMMHQGLVEHFAGQKIFFSDFIVDNHQSLAQLFASFGMEVVFTGHFHAQDVVKANVCPGALYDVATGSAASFPCPYRLLSLDPNGMLAITSHFITNINYDLGGVPFPAYASNKVYAGWVDISAILLKNPPFALSQTNVQYVAPALAEALVSHYQGDEGTRPLSASTQGILAYLRGQADPASQIVVNLLTALFTDGPPPDNNLTIHLMTGGAQ